MSGWIYRNSATDEPDEPKSLAVRPRRRRLRGAAAGMFVGAAVVVAGFVFDRTLMIVVGVLVITASWWLAAEMSIRPLRRKRSK
jgi:hypothetical protein